LGAWAGDVDESPESVYQKATSILAGSGLKTISTIPSQSLAAEGPKELEEHERNIVIALVVIGILLFIVYAIMRGWLWLVLGFVLLVAGGAYYFIGGEKNSFTVGITRIPQGSRISITSRGDKAEASQNQLIGILVPARAAAPVAAGIRCSKCGATVPDASDAFCPSCGAKL